MSKGAAKAPTVAVPRVRRARSFLRVVSDKAWKTASRCWSDRLTIRLNIVAVDNHVANTNTGRFTGLPSVRQSPAWVPRVSWSPSEAAGPLQEPNVRYTGQFEARSARRAPLASLPP